MLLGLLLFILAEPAPGVRVLHAGADETISELFKRSEGWIGGDGVYSVVVAPERRVWLFSDTWIGRIKEGKRTDATIVNNTVGIQAGSSKRAKVQFYIPRDGDGKPTAFIRPPNESTWFWLFGGVAAAGKLHFFPAEIERTDDKSVFGFRQVGQWLATVTNPDAEPLTWQTKLEKLPFADFTAGRERSFGSAVVTHEGWTYVFGFVQEAAKPFIKRSLVVARVRSEELECFSAWQFFGEQGWQDKPENVAPLFAAAAPELSVSYLPRWRLFVAVYTENGLSPRILARTAPFPNGPWSAPLEIYRCPEVAADQKLFTYAAKAHAGMGGEDELIVSYVVNSLDFWQVARDAQLYWPKFIRVKLAPVP